MGDVNHYRDARFIPDLPADSDEFASRSHKRVADTLLEIVTGSEGGRAIGLEGTWGSGKSTVIDLALGGFEVWNKKNTPKQAVFVFDAWAHQSDPLRRVFLEELIDVLSKNNVVGKDKWQEQLEQLRARRKRTTETRAEKLSWAARVTLLTLPLYPLAYGFIASAIKETSPVTTAVPPGIDLPLIGSVSLTLLFFVGSLIILAPYFTAFLTWLSWRGKPEMHGKSVVWAFNKQTDHVTTEQLVREDEATTVEFNAEFDKLVQDVKTNGFRLVIVLDNLDRLANQQIREIWATMRNFFAATHGSQRRETLKNVWLIVPVDRQHIESVFADGEQDVHNITTRGFVEKTFEIVLRVPPPLLSNWQEFLSGKLRYAFGGKISGDEVYRLFRLFELYHAAHPIVITPRVIKAYVNKIVGQAKLSGNLIPLEYLGLFVLYKDKIADDVGKLQDSSILDAPVADSIADPEWTKYLAAAHYCVRPDVALELLLARDIESVLLEHNRSGRLGELQKTSGFDSILHGVVSEKSGLWAKENPANYLDIAATLNKLDIGDVAASNHIWRDMAFAAARIESAINPTDSTAEGIKAIVVRSAALSDKLRTARELRRGLSISRGEAAEPTQAEGIAWFRLWEALAGALANHGESSQITPLVSSIPVQKGVQFFLGVAEAASKSSVLPMANFAPADSVEEITSAVVEIVQSGDPGPSVESIVTALLSAPTLANWKALISAIQTRLQQNDPALKASAGQRLLNLLRKMSRSQARAQSSLKALNDDGSLHGLLEMGRREKSNDLVGQALYELMLHGSGDLLGPVEHGKYGKLGPANEYLSQAQTNASLEAPVVEVIVRLCQEGDDLGRILASALPTDATREIYRAILRRLIETDAYRTLPVGELLSNFDRVSEILGSELLKRLLGSIDRLDIATALSGDKWKSVQPSYLKAVKEHGAEQYAKVVAAIRAGLAALNSEQWTEALSNEANELALVFSLIDAEQLGSLETALFDALRSYSQRLIDGEVTPSKYTGRWRELPLVLTGSQRPHLYKTVRDQVINKVPTAEVVRRVFNLFGPEFSQNAGLADRPTDVVRTIIDPMLADGTDESLACLEENSRSLAMTIAKASNADQQFVSERFDSMIVDSDEERRARLIKLAESLGVELKAEAEAESADEAVGA